MTSETKRGGEMIGTDTSVSGAADLGAIQSGRRAGGPMQPSISVVVPVYNSKGTLPELVQRLESVLSELTDEYELILVNDGSRDGSWLVIEELARRHSWVSGFDLMHNYGQHNALLAGIDKAQNEAIVTIDDDLQHPPEEIPKLISKLGEGFDVVYGQPATRHHSAWRNFSSRTLQVVSNVVLGSEMGSHFSAFRAFRAILRRGFASFADAQLSIDVLLSWSANRVTHVKVAHHPRREGRTGYTLGKLMRLAFSMITGYSSLPLRVASSLGLFASLIGLALFLYVVIQRLVQTTPVPGFTFLAAEIALFAGLQLFAIGIIGEYIARLHFRTMGKPPYVIRESVGSDLPPATDWESGPGLE